MVKLCRLSLKEDECTLHSWPLNRTLLVPLHYTTITYKAITLAAGLNLAWVQCNNKKQ